MRIWIAEDVLCDYTCGIIVITAKDEKEAVEQLSEKFVEFLEAENND